MNHLAELIPALWIIFDPLNIFILFAGTVVGIILGVLPGFGAAQALALMFPFTFWMTPEAGVIFFIAIYAAAEYGGAIPAILIRTPGTSAAAMTVLDGYPMAQQGKAGRALKISLYTGVFGSFVSSFAFIFLASSLAWIGLMFGPSEMFAIGIFGLSIIGGFFGDSPVKGFAATAIGLFLATIGSSGFSGLRFTFGMPSLMEGVPVLVVIIGVLAIPEVFRLMIDRKETSDTLEVIETKNDAANTLTLKDWRNLMPTMLRATAIGTVIGAIPGPGATVSAVVAYNEEKRFSKHPEKFGTGIDEGIAAPETANNAIVAGSLIPSLALGIPGSAAIAILLGLLISKGVAPGPMMFAQGGPLVMTVFLALLVSALMMAVVGGMGIRVFTLIARVPRYILAPFVFVLLMVGTYSYQGYGEHIIMAMVIGAAAFWLEKINVPTIPIVLAFVMGPIIEANLNRALVINGGSMNFLFTRPLALSIVVLALALAIWSYVRSRRDAKQAPAQTTGA